MARNIVAIEALLAHRKGMGAKLTRTVVALCVLMLASMTGVARADSGQGGPPAGVPLPPANATSTTLGTAPLSASECAAWRRSRPDAICQIRYGVTTAPDSTGATAPIGTTATDTTAVYCQLGDVMQSNGYCHNNTWIWETDASGKIFKWECYWGTEYNDKYAYSYNGPNCYTVFAYGWSLSNDSGSPHVANNGAQPQPNGIMTMTDFWHACAVFQGSPICYGHWFKETVNEYGYHTEQVS